YVESPPLTDRGSIFISYAISTTSPSAPKSLISNLRRLHASSREGEASHYMYAYRVLVPRKGKTGAEGEGDDTWTVKEGEDDDNEKYGGETIRKEMERLGGVDATCVVVRWFGGTLLGPARFQHIRTVVSQSISLLNERIYIEGEIQKLKELDHWINELLLKTGGKEEDEKEYGVETMDRSRAERLMKARRGRKEMLEKKLKG
ncbi:ribosomal protein S5 domain 2-like protein, partial [Atractiella rhizophila]